jgi:hypothetical protein
MKDALIKPMSQHALTVMVKIDQAKAAANRLTEVLDIIGQDIRGVRQNTYIDFSKLQTVHFMRWVLIPNDVAGGWDYLLFTTNHDGPLYLHLNELIEHGGQALDLIFGSCVGYPANRSTDLPGFQRDFRAFIQANSIENETFYLGYRGETVGNVRGYIAVRRQLQALFDLEDVQRFAARHLEPLLLDLPVRPAINPILKRISDGLRFIAKVIVFVFDVLLELVYTFIIRPISRMLLRREPALGLVLVDDDIRPGVEAIEDAVTQNQMTVISRIKPGFWPLFKLKIVLLAIDLVARHFLNQGSLGGIISIHFARWTILDRGRYLFFESNYDGSWESYIGEFIDKAASGMDLIWTATPGYPEKGASDLEAFKSIIRRNQLKTQVFYSAYPDSTVRNILNDREISRDLDQAKIREWLKRF